MTCNQRSEWVLLGPGEVGLKMAAKAILPRVVPVQFVWPDFEDLMNKNRRF